MNQPDARLTYLAIALLPSSELSVEEYDAVSQYNDVHRWRRLRYGDLELSNCIEYASFNSNPIAPMVCDTCCVPWCGPCGLARVVRTEDQLIWLPPYHSDEQWIDLAAITPDRFITDAFLVPSAQWDDIQQTVPELPVSTQFPQITNHDLIHLWLQQRPEFAVEGQYATLIQHFRSNCVASHPLDIDAALATLASYEAAITAAPITQNGTLAAIMPDPELFNTFYFDSDTFPELVAFRVSDSQPVIAGQLVFEAS